MIKVAFVALACHITGLTQFVVCDITMLFGGKEISWMKRIKSCCEQNMFEQYKPPNPLIIKITFYVKREWFSKIHILKVARFQKI